MSEYSAHCCHSIKYGSCGINFDGLPEGNYYLIELENGCHFGSEFKVIRWIGWCYLVRLSPEYKLIITDHGDIRNPLLFQIKEIA